MFEFALSVFCPARQGWVYFGGNLYQVSSTKKSWGESRRDCQQKGADLLIINSREEQQSWESFLSCFKKVFANQFKKYMWIGLTDVATDGVWKWVDGTKVSTSYWSSGEPNGKKSENCADIKNHGTELSWNDESCSISLFWICEKRFLQ
uniref:C-type lectin domain-containing protein n=1 Tax=Tetraodon nigroviridis TaxID=99883 RepID=H3C712_TETNG